MVKQCHTPAIWEWFATPMVGPSELLDPVGQFGFFFQRPFGWESP